MSRSGRKLTLLALGGVFTAPDFLDEFREEMRRRGERAGWDVAAHTVMPYGDWTAPRLRQAAEVTADALLPAFGGRRASAEAVRLCGEDLGAGGIALLGHSGGGLAAVRAANAWMKRGLRICAVVMIGSPKTPIAARLRDKTAYLYLGGESGRTKDPVTKAGSWFGRPPALVQSLPLIGGHPDYFRSRPPFVNASGRSNLEITAEAAWQWLRHTSEPGE